MSSNPAASLAPLSEEELDMCRKAFTMFDKDGTGTIDVRELKTALIALGQQPSDEELFVMISQVDEDGSKEIEFSEFVHVIQLNKSITEKNSDEQDALDAFVALGGNPDKTGRIPALKITNIAQEFELTINVEAMFKDADPDAPRSLGFEEFKILLS